MSRMYFEGRELKPWAEFVAAEELKEGVVYFRVHYLDHQMLIPALEPLVFIGEDLEPEDEDVLYFQEAHSYLAGERPFDESKRSDDQQTCSEVIVHTMNAADCHVLEYDKAIDVLLQCALRREKKADPTNP